MEWPEDSAVYSKVDEISRQYEEMMRVVRESAERAGLITEEEKKSTGRRPLWTPILTEIEKERRLLTAMCRAAIQLIRHKE